jgi:HAD superfamily hydrolase (TIGR01509 family)
VLVDTEIWWDDIRRDFAARRGRAWTADDRDAVMGRNSRGWALVMRDRLGVDEPLDAIEREVVDAMVARFAAEGVPTLPGAVETVGRLAGSLPLGLASSAHPAVIAAALHGGGLASFVAAVAASDEVAHGKPSPDVYLLAAERLGVAPRTCLVVEDSLNGILAGRAAGMTVVLVPNAAVPPPPDAFAVADVVLATIGEVDPDAIRVLLERNSPA